MVVLTQRYPKQGSPDGEGCEGKGWPDVGLRVLALTAEARVRSRHRHLLPSGEPVNLQLPRGTCLQHGDRLTTAAGEAVVQIVAKPEPVMTVRAATPLLLKAAYHLGNRHVPLEVTADWLRLSPDPVLKTLLVEQLQVDVVVESAPFQPEVGAYHGHASRTDRAKHHHHVH